MDSQGGHIHSAATVLMHHDSLRLNNFILSLRIPADPCHNCFHIQAQIEFNRVIMSRRVLEVSERPKIILSLFVSSCRVVGHVTCFRGAHLPSPEETGKPLVARAFEASNIFERRCHDKCHMLSRHKMSKVGHTLQISVTNLGVETC